MHADFSRIFNDDPQIRRGLKRLTDERYLVHIGYSLYSKAKRSSLIEKIILVAPLGHEAIRKPEYEIDLAPKKKSNLLGEHNQIFSGRTLVVRGRCSRKISYGDKHLNIRNSFTWPG